MKKKYSKKEEEKQMNGWLYGWKDIAQYLGCGIETAEIYYRKYRLPVVKTPTGKPMCHPKKIDRWVETTQFSLKNR